MATFDLELAKRAIAAIESRGSGDYGAVGPETASGDRAYGRYQVMGANIPSWTKAALGRSMSPQEFLADPAAQDAVFSDQWNKNVAKYGSVRDAASVWFSGVPYERATREGRADSLGTSAREYVDRFSSLYGDRSAPSTRTAAARGGGGMANEYGPPDDVLATFQDAARAAGADSEAAQNDILFELMRTSAPQMTVPKDPSKKNVLLQALLGFVQGAAGGQQGAARATALAASQASELHRAQEQAKAQNLQQQSYAELRKTNLTERLAQIRERASARSNELMTDLAKIREGRSLQAKAGADARALAQQQHDWNMDEIRLKAQLSGDAVKTGNVMYDKDQQLTDIGAMLYERLDILQDGGIVTPDGELDPMTPVQLDHLFNRVGQSIDRLALRESNDPKLRAFVEQFDAAKAAHEKAAEQVITDVLGPNKAARLQKRSRDKDSLMSFFFGQNTGRPEGAPLSPAENERAQAMWNKKYGLSGGGPSVGIATEEELDTLNLLNESINAPAEMDLPGLFLSGRPSIFDSPALRAQRQVDAAVQDSLGTRR